MMNNRHYFTKIWCNWGDGRLQADSHLQQEMIARINGESLESSTVGEEWQGCFMSHLLFSFQAELMTRNSIDTVKGSEKVCDEMVKDIRFPDD